MSNSPPVTASIAASGQSIALLFEDGSGNPVDVKSISNLDDIQTITLDGNPAGSAFSLTFNGQTTAPIPVTTNPPDSYGLWTIPTVVGHSYSVAATWPSKYGGGASSQVFELLDGSHAVLATLHRTMQALPSGLADGTLPDGAPAYWDTIGTFTATGTSYYVRVSATTDGQWYIDALRVADATAGTVAHQDDQDGSLSAVGSINGTYTGQGDCFGGTVTAIGASGASTIYRASPSAIQSALLALSTVQPGGVSASPSADGPYPITFVGPMGGVSQPSITCADPAVSIAHTQAGGNAPTYSLNGGAAVPLARAPIWSTSAPYVHFNLIQAAPAVQYAQSNDGRFTSRGFNSYGIASPSGGGVSGRPSYCDANTSTGYALFTFSSLPPGTYQFAATWAPSDSAYLVGYGYSPISTHAVFEVLDGSNAVLASAVVDQSAAPSDVVDGGFGYKSLPAVTIAPGSPNTTLKLYLTTAGSTGTLLIDAIRLARTSADYSVTFGPVDAVTINIPDNYVVTSLGPVPAQAIVAANKVGGSLLDPFDPSSVTMHVGYNCEGDGLNGTGFLYSNLVRRNGVVGGLGKVLAYDPLGDYPTKIDGPAQRGIPIALTGNLFGELNKGLACLPSGYYTVLWDWDGTHAASNLYLEAFSDYTVTEVTSYANFTGKTGNVRVFHLQAGRTQLSTAVELTITGVSNGDGTYLTSLRNLRIYPPNPSDPTGMTPWGVAETPPKYHPNFWKMVGAAQCLRWLDPLNTNNNQVQDFTDFKPQSVLRAGGGYRNVSAAITSITPVPAGVDPFFSTRRSCIAQVTTATPHGLFDGCGSSSISGTGATATLSDGTTYPLDGNPPAIHVVSPTAFLFQFAPTNDPLHAFRTMTNSIGAGGTVSAQVGSSMSLEDIFEICSLANGGVGVDPWINVPGSATPACIASLAAFAAARTPAGHKCYVEFSNECWNFGFNTFQWARTLSYRANTAVNDDINYVPGYVKAMKAAHAAFVAAFVAAGRPASDVVRVCGTCGGNSGTTAGIAAELVAQSATVDVMATAPYFDNQMGGNPSSPDYDLMTTGQSLDHYELNLAYGYLIDAEVTEHLKVLEAAGLTGVKIVNYEGGMDLPVPGLSQADGLDRSAAILRHPRMYTLQLGYFQYLQKAGVALSNIFFLAGFVPTEDGQETGWCVWISHDQQPGTGDPVADALNISSPFAVDRVKSEQGGAINHWASLVPGSAPPPPPKPKRLIPGRNGQIRAIGFPRGAFRPSR